MTEKYFCTFVNCGMVFLKAYELKKHKATHEDPSSVYYCSLCDFFTLQKKNLGIHFAIHTGEKFYQCPDVISFVRSLGSPSLEERCDYRTNDPAALTKHRKKVHGYIPPPNRGRPSKAAPTAPRKSPRQKQDRKVSRYPRRPVTISCRKQSRVPRVANKSVSGAGYSSTSAQSPDDCSSLHCQGDVDGYRQRMDATSYDVSGCGSSISSSAMLVAPNEEMDLTTLYDPSLHSEWMAQYMMGYGMSNVTGMQHLPEPLHTVPPPPLANLDMMQTGREGCLCPEWMVEARVPGWDQSMLETYREF